MTPVRLKPAAPRSRVTHSATEPLRPYNSDNVTDILKICMRKLNDDFYCNVHFVKSAPLRALSLYVNTL